MSESAGFVPETLQSPEVHHDLFRLLHIQVEIVVLDPRGQEPQLTPVDCLVFVDKTTTVMSSANLMKRLDVGVQLWRAPVFSVMVLEVLLLTLTACVLPVRKSSSQFIKSTYRMKLLSESNSL